MKSFKTKFGTAYVTSRGYVKICSVKEGNENKLLHRLVFEDFYNVKLPSNIIIHHNDGNKSNNEIWNLIPMTVEEHNRLHHKGFHHTEEIKNQISNSMKGEKNHFYGKHHTDETKRLLSEQRKGIPFGNHTAESKRLISLKKNTTGYLNVSLVRCNDHRNGFYYRYNYFEGRTKALYGGSLIDLKEKVISKGLPWEVIDEEKAKITKKICEENWERYKKEKKKFETPYYNVKKCNAKKYKYSYRYYNDKNQIRYLRANSIEDLEKRVKKRGWRWEKLT